MKGRKNNLHLNSFWWKEEDDMRRLCKWLWLGSKAQRPQKVKHDKNGQMLSIIMG
jgi:hypothetical protein